MKIAVHLENALTCAEDDRDIAEIFETYKEHVVSVAQAEEVLSVLLFKDLSAHVADAETRAFYTCESIVPYLEVEWIERLLEDIQGSTTETKH